VVDIQERTHQGIYLQIALNKDSTIFYKENGEERKEYIGKDLVILSIKEDGTNPIISEVNEIVGKKCLVFDSRNLYNAWATFEKGKDNRLVLVFDGEFTKGSKYYIKEITSFYVDKIIITNQRIIDQPIIK
jgi:hypothetical protein